MAERKYFLGIPILTEADIEAGRASGELHVYGVSRVTDVPASFGSPELQARRTRTICEVCREVCWLDPAGFDELRGTRIEIVCIQCLAARVRLAKAEQKGQPNG